MKHFNLTLISEKKINYEQFFNSTTIPYSNYIPVHSGKFCKYFFQCFDIYDMPFNSEYLENAVKNYFQFYEVFYRIEGRNSFDYVATDFEKFLIEQNDT